ncbi:uncharacterized protein [Nicotiana tomentosiformis]|uniref:uncharacterized protein n=1 Tax=Nicotiana tomentosiformis TaxID=4098 RepID=UPI00388CA8F8
MVKANEEVQIDINDNVEEAHKEVNPSRDHMVDILEPVVQKAKAPMPRPPPPYPQRLAKKNGENQFKRFIDMMKSLSINVPLVEALEQISGYAMFMKDLVTKKRSMNFETIKMTHQVSAIVHSMAPKVGGSRRFHDSLYHWGCQVDYEVPIILGRPFLSTRKALVYVEAGELTFQVGDEKVVFHVCKSMRQPNSKEVYCFVDLVTDVIIDETSAVMNVDDTFEALLLNFDDD